MLLSLPSALVGSGVILLVIVAAWLAVLVPMALRSHDQADSLSSVERFSDAMRVLARRDPAARARARAVAGPQRLGEDDGDLLLDEGGLDHDPLDEWEERESLRERAARLAAAVRHRRPGTPAARRRRLLLALLALAVVTLAAGLLAGPVLLAVHGAVDVALVLYVVQLRRLAAARRPSPVRQAAPARRPAAALREQRAARPVRSSVPTPRAEPAPVATKPLAVFDQEAVVAPAGGTGPGTAADAGADRSDWPADVVVEAPAAEPEQPRQRAVSGLGAPWTPVPVPPPLYAGKAVAQRPRGPVEPPAASQTSAHAAMPPGSEPAPQPRREDRRRAVNDW